MTFKNHRRGILGSQLLDILLVLAILGLVVFGALRLYKKDVNELPNATANTCSISLGGTCVNKTLGCENGYVQAEQFSFVSCPKPEQICCVAASAKGTSAPTPQGGSSCQQLGGTCYASAACASGFESVQGSCAAFPGQPTCCKPQATTTTPTTDADKACVAKGGTCLSTCSGYTQSGTCTNNKCCLVPAGVKTG